MEGSFMGTKGQEEKYLSRVTLLSGGDLKPHWGLKILVPAPFPRLPSVAHCWVSMLWGAGGDASQRETLLKPPTPWPWKRAALLAV